MKVEQFIKKWSASELGEDKHGKGSVLHFLDLCALLGVPTPSDTDLKGTHYCFEKGLSQTTGARGWADVWKKGCFAWEYKGKGKDLDKAFEQLLRYAAALENPPLLIVSDMERIIIHTNWTNTVSQIHEFTLSDLAKSEVQDTLRWCFENPEKLKPSKTTKAVTEKAAAKFAELAYRLRQRGDNPEKVAHFVNRLAFCMFAEDANLLPHDFFTDRLYKLVNHPDRAEATLKSLFTAMSKGGQYGDDLIPYFNGGLFDNDDVLKLGRDDLALLHDIAKENDWQDIDPSIFGTLFERGLDPTKRSQLGAHYTDAEKIEMIIGPVVRDPLLREWEEVKAKLQKAKQGKARQKVYGEFMNRLSGYRVLDPACGSGNFLYLALKALKDIEHRVHLECENIGIQRPLFMATGPHNMLGIELNSYAAELARMTVWIGEIQWCLKHGQPIDQNPILKPLRTVENRDALLNDDGTEAKWPAADAIVGNPPFLGGKKLQPELGSTYIKKLRAIYGNKISDGADFVCFWFLKSHEAILQKQTLRAGLVATNNIKARTNRGVLEKICIGTPIYLAWSNEPWTVDGASVRVAIICYSEAFLDKLSPKLNNKPVTTIHANLTASDKNGGADLTKAHPLDSNKNTCFQGVVARSSLNSKAAKMYALPDASFIIDSLTARKFLLAKGNPNGRPNSDVIKRFLIGDDVTSRIEDRFIIDFNNMTESEASLYELPFEHILPVRAHRAKMNQPQALTYWWLHWNSRPALRNATKDFSKVIATPETAKHRIFQWCDTRALPDHTLYIFARNDDVSFGILHSKFHELWSINTGPHYGNHPTAIRYTPRTTFAPFPFPKGLEPNRKPSDYKNPHAAKIAEAARVLNERREAWLNPPDLVKREKEVVAGYPDRILPVDAAAAETLKERTLTKLYNAKPAWLKQAHADLDAAVAAAYGWPADLTDDEILAKLLGMNLGGK